MLCGLLHNQKTANLLYPAESLSHSLCCFPLLRRRGGRLPYCASWTEHQTKAGHGLPEKALNRKIKTDTKHPVQLSRVSPRHLISHCGYFKCLVVVREVTGLCGEGDKAWKKSDVLLLSYPQAVNTLEGVFAFLRFPLALSPALPSRGASRVCRGVGSLSVRPALDADGIVL